MQYIGSIFALIDLWPSRSVMAAECLVSKSRVDNWAKGNSIPARFHAQVIRAATARGFAVDAELLVALHDRPAHSEAAE